MSEYSTEEYEPTDGVTYRKANNCHSDPQSDSCKWGSANPYQ